MTGERLEAYRRFQRAAGNRRHMLREQAYAEVLDAAEALLLARNLREAHAAREEAAAILLQEGDVSGARAEAAEMLWLALRGCGPDETWPPLALVSEPPLAPLSQP